MYKNKCGAPDIRYMETELVVVHVPLFSSLSCDFDSTLLNRMKHLLFEKITNKSS